ncbi:MaoC family dehydratase [Chloroflexota bacterium]
MAIPSLTRYITQEDINLYAEASRDFNPVHLDEVFARSMQFDGTIAHGMLVLAYVSQMMTDAFGEYWLTGGRLNVRFKTPARPGDTVTVSGEVRSVEEVAGRLQAGFSVLCRNQKGETIITGEAELRKDVA